MCAKKVVKKVLKKTVKPIKKTQIMSTDDVYVENKIFNRWKRDDRIYAVLRRRGYNCIEKVITTKEIDWKSSEKNCGRMSRNISEDKIWQYAQTLENGDTKFPMCLVTELKTGYLTVAGYHRLKGQDTYDENIEIPVYIVNDLILYDDIELIAFETNMLEGTSPTRDERLEKALARVIRSDGKHVEENAKDFMVKPGTLRARYHCYELKRMAVEVGCSKANKLDDSQAKSLRVIRSERPILKSLVGLALTYSLGGDDLRSIIEIIKTKLSEEDKLDYIDKEFDRLSKMNEKKSRARSKRRFVHKESQRIINSAINHFSVNNTLEKLQLIKGSDEHENIKDRFNILKDLFSKSVR